MENSTTITERMADLDRQMDAAAERGDRAEYGRLLSAKMALRGQRTRRARYARNRAENFWGQPGRRSS